ncbi:N-acetylneuraminate synthase family protein [Candidatus Pelagibacter sp.]|nr:N-acetylneuraminate synthase family protein [Candidatus Pelagibacter sp.]
MIKINKKLNKVFKIAEIGVNHNGILKNAFKLIDHASKSGFDAVKFQTFDIDTMLLSDTKLAKYQKKTKFKDMKEMLKKLSLTGDDFYKIKKYCKKKKIFFLSTPFDIKSAEFLNKLNVPIFKIASSDLDNFLLLKKIKSFKKPLIISTGMSTMTEIKKTLSFLKLPRNKLIIMHCVSEYPTKLDESQLGFILELKKLKYPIGLSDHTVGFESSIASTALGVRIIEKHITLNNNMHGPDHQSSMHIKHLKKFVKTIDDLVKSLHQKKRTLSKEEKGNAKVAKKALYYSKSLKKYKRVNLNDLISLRPLASGISPSNYNFFIGKKLKKKIKKFQILKKSDFI